MEENKKIELIGQYGATLSIIEVGLGSILHALHVPLSGVLLSLNQGYILCRAALKSDSKNEWTTYSISNVSAVLKSFSPAGKKLGPMLSLSMQGLLFNSGTRLLGTNLLGLCFSMALLSLWAFIQPLITYYFFFGEKLFSAAEFLYQKTLPYHGLQPESLIWIFALLVISKIAVGCFLAFIAWKRKDKALYVKNYEEEFIRIAKEKMNNHSNETTQQNPSLGALRDLFRPFFVISLLMTGAFLYFSNSDHSQVGWYLLRPIGVGFIFFYVSRTLTLDRWLIKLENGRFHSFSQGCKFALLKLRSLI